MMIIARDTKSSNKKSLFSRSRLASLTAMITGAFALSVAQPALSQSQSEVRLESPNGAVSVQGELLGVDDQFYTIKGVIGTMKISRAAVECFGASCPVEEIAAPAAPATREVVLKAKDDETQVIGELVGVETKHYVIRNALGEFRIAIANVECEGPACPNVEVYDPKFAMYGATPEINMMLADMLRAYANETGQIFEADVIDGDKRTVRVLSSENQEVLAEISLMVENSQQAVDALLNKSADVLVYGQQQFASGATPAGVQQNVLAFDGQVIVGHKSNPVRNFSLVEVERIWNGQLTSWRPLGAGNFPITVHMVDGAATGDSSASVWPAGANASNANNVVTHGTEAEVIEAVNSDRNAIGFVRRASAATANAKMMEMRKVCGLTSAPTNFDIRTGQYQFTQPLYTFARNSGMHPFAQSFLAWTQTPAAEPSISQWGYTGTQLQRSKIQDMGVAVVHTAAVEPDFDGAEFATMMRELRSADRLSITFRFLPGSAALDEASVLSIKDLAERLRRSEFDGQEVLLVGFADSVGPADRNTFLSARRAETVKDLLASEFDEATRSRLNLTELGYGEQMPVDCNNTDTGRGNNRRVEVWVRAQS